MAKKLKSEENDNQEVIDSELTEEIIMEEEIESSPMIEDKPEKVPTLYEMKVADEKAEVMFEKLIEHMIVMEKLRKKINKPWRHTFFTKVQLERLYRNFKRSIK